MRVSSAHCHVNASPPWTHGRPSRCRGKEVTRPPTRDPDVKTPATVCLGHLISQRPATSSGLPADRSSLHAHSRYLVREATSEIGRRSGRGLQTGQATGRARGSLVIYRTGRSRGPRARSDRPKASDGQNRPADFVGCNAQRSPIGVRSVVTTTISTRAENVVWERRGRPSSTRAVPIPAKIRPTSPRGTIPMPTASRLIPGPTTADRARELARNRDEHQHRAEYEALASQKARDVNLDAHQHEEQRNEHAGDGRQQLRERRLRF